MNIPHVRAWYPWGHSHIGQKEMNTFRHAARDKGIASFWIGSHLVYIITDNQVRRMVHDQRKIGVIDAEADEVLKAISGGNRIMHNFPNFQIISSDTYRLQRSYLVSHFHSNISHRLREIATATDEFLRTISGTISIRDFSNMIVLHVTSRVIGWVGPGLDIIYAQNEQFRQVYSKVAHYGIAKRHDHNLELQMYRLFEQIIPDQYENMISEQSLLVNIMQSHNIDIPQSYTDFIDLSESMKIDIAMTFWATVLGAAVHSTATSLDWLLARLSSKTIATAIDVDVDVCAISEYDRDGRLFGLTLLVLENLLLYPAFPFQFYLNIRDNYISGLDVTLPTGCFILNDYVSCHRSEFKDNEIWQFLMDLPTPTVRSFANSNRVAAFGGTLRRCPGRDLAIYEQLIILATIMRRSMLHSVTDVSLDVDHSTFPLRTRVDKGVIRF